jgi:hypothetical protein
MKPSMAANIAVIDNQHACVSAFERNEAGPPRDSQLQPLARASSTSLGDDVFGSLIERRHQPPNFIGWAGTSETIGMIGAAQQPVDRLRGLTRTPNIRPAGAG